MPLVTIQKIHDAIPKALDTLLQPFADSLDLAGRSVLIKPNLVEPLAYTTGQTTNPDLVDALIFWCKNRGASHIAVGEGPSYFQPRSALEDCFVKTGIAAAAKRHETPWILFDNESYREFRDYSPRTPQRFLVSEHAFTWDVIMNLPVPKTHYLTTASIAMKNLKGFLRREDKPSFHHCGTQGIYGSVTELNCIVRPTISIVDCTAPVHRNSNYLLAGTDIVATDAVTSSLMGLNPREIRTISLGHEAGLGEMDISRISIAGDDLKGLAMSFEQPGEYLKRAFPLLHLSGARACSGCLIPLFSCLRRLEEEGVQMSEEVTLHCGKEETVQDRGTLLCVGACTKEHARKKPWLNGCPPTKEELYEFLRKHM